LGRDPDIEYLCNRFAESLLLPSSELKSLGIQDQSRLPRLDLISSLSAKYKLEERAVVRKLFAGPGARFAGIVCLEKLPTQKWTTRWCVISKWAYESGSPSGFGIPLHHKKAVPREMVPEIPYGETVAVTVDGRWWEGLKQVPASIKKIPFERMSREDSRQAIAFKLSDSIYLGLPPA
jgi:hypothetical protein